MRHRGERPHAENPDRVLEGKMLLLCGRYGNQGAAALRSVTAPRLTPRCNGRARPFGTADREFYSEDTFREDFPLSHDFVRGVAVKGVLIGAVFLLSAATATAQTTDSAARAAFPDPIYAKWAKTYKGKPDLPLQGR
jgi:hypothetical protein